MPLTASYQVLLQYTVSSTVDVTADVAEIEYERKLSTFRRSMEAGRGQVTLHNVYGRYSPTNQIAGIPLPLSLGIKITGVSSGSGGDIVLFQGTIDEYSVSLDKPQTATFRIADMGKLLVERESFTTLDQQPSNVTSLLNEACLFAGLTTAQISVSNLNDTRLNVGYGHMPAGEIIHDIIKTGGHLAFVGRGGVVRVEPRYWDSSQSAITTYTSFSSFDYAYTDEDVINKIVGRGTFWAPAGGNFNIEAGMDNVIVPGSTEVVELFDYVESGDNIMAAGSIVNGYLATVTGTGGGDITDSVQVFTDANYATSTLIKFQNFGPLTAHVRSIVLLMLAPFRVRAEGMRYRDCASSQAVYGVREISIESIAWEPYSAALVYAEFIFANYSTPKPRIGVSVKNDYPYVLTADLGNQLALINTEVGVDGNYIIYGARERITHGEGWVHQVSYELEQQLVPRPTLHLSAENFVSGPIWFDVSSNNYDFYRGTATSGDAAEPTFVAGPPPNWSFGGGHNFSYTGSPNATWMQNIHKANAKYSMVTLVNFATDFSFQGIAGSAQASVASNVGFYFWRGNDNALVFGISANKVSSLALQYVSVHSVSAGAWHVLGVSVDEDAGWGFMAIDGVIEKFTSTYLSPVNSDSTFIMRLGSVGNGQISMTSGGLMYSFSAWEGFALTPDQYFTQRANLRRIFGV